jgi:DNA-nicking Smr family endonuclease
MKKALKAMFIVLIGCYMIFFVNNTFAQGLTDSDKDHIVQQFISAFSTQEEVGIGINNGLLAALLTDAGNSREYRDIYDIISHRSLVELRNPDVINIVIRRIPELAAQLLQIAQDNEIANVATYMAAITAFGNLNDTGKLEETFNQIEVQAGPNIYAAYIEAIGIFSFQEAENKFLKANKMFGNKQIIDEAFARVIANHYPGKFEAVVRQYNITINSDNMVKIAMHAFIQAGEFFKMKALFDKNHQLTNGKFLDLHGYSLPETWIILSELLERAYTSTSKEKYIVLIPGKGIHSDHGSSVIQAINLFAQCLSTILEQEVHIKHDMFNSGRICILLPAVFFRCDIGEILKQIATTKFKYHPTEQPRWQPNLPDNMQNIQPKWEEDEHKQLRTLHLCDFLDHRLLLRFDSSSVALVKPDYLLPQLMPKQSQQPPKRVASAKKTPQSPPSRPGKKGKNIRHTEQTKMEQTKAEQAKKKAEDTLLDKYCKNARQEKEALSIKAILAKDSYTLITICDQDGKPESWTEQVLFEYLRATHKNGINCGKEEIKMKAVRIFVERILLGGEVSFDQVTETFVFLSQNNQWDILTDIFEKLTMSIDKAEIDQALEKLFDNILEQVSDYRFNKDHVVFGMAIIISTRFPEYADILVKVIRQKGRLSPPLIAILIKTCGEHGNVKQAMSLLQGALADEVLNPVGLFNAMNLCVNNGLIHYAATNVLTKKVLATTFKFYDKFAVFVDTYNDILKTYRLQDQVGLISVDDMIQTIFTLRDKIIECAEHKQRVELANDFGTKTPNWQIDPDGDMMRQAMELVRTAPKGGTMLAFYHSPDGDIVRQIDDPEAFLEQQKLMKTIPPLDQEMLDIFTNWVHSSSANKKLSGETAIDGLASRTDLENFIIGEAGGDGNCFPLSVLAVLRKLEERGLLKNVSILGKSISDATPQDLRMLVVQYMRDRRQDFMNLMINNEDFDDYLDRMGTDGEFVEGVFVPATALAIGQGIIRIWIYDDHDTPPQPFDFGSVTAPIIHLGHYTDVHYVPLYEHVLVATANQQIQAQDGGALVGFNELNATRQEQISLEHMQLPPPTQPAVDNVAAEQHNPGDIPAADQGANLGNADDHNQLGTPASQAPAPDAKLSTTDETNHAKPTTPGYPIGTTVINDGNSLSTVDTGFMQFDFDFKSFLKTQTKMRELIIKDSSEVDSSESLNYLSKQISSSSEIMQEYLDRLWQVVKNAIMEPKAAVNNNPYNLPGYQDLFNYQDNIPQVDTTSSRDRKFRIPQRVLSRKKIPVGG